METTGDMFRDAIAFARCVMRDDVEGMETLLKMQENPVHLLVPQSWILNAAIARLAIHIEKSVDETWLILLSSLDVLEEEDKNEDSGD